MTNQADEFAEWERAITEGTFEDALMALEKAARRLEAGNLSLADSVRCFEVGIVSPFVAAPCWMRPNCGFHDSINLNRTRSRSSPWRLREIVRVRSAAFNWKISGRAFSSMLSKRICADPASSSAPPSAWTPPRSRSAVRFSSSKPIRSPLRLIGTLLPRQRQRERIACLGATPRWLLVTALLPAGSTTRESVSRMFDEFSRPVTNDTSSCRRAHRDHGRARPTDFGRSDARNQRRRNDCSTRQAKPAIVC